MVDFLKNSPQTNKPKFEFIYFMSSNHQQLRSAILHLYLYVNWCQQCQSKCLTPVHPSRCILHADVHNGNFLLIHFCHTGNWRYISMRYKNLTHQRHWFQYHHQATSLIFNTIIRTLFHSLLPTLNETHSVRTTINNHHHWKIISPFNNFNFSTHHHHGCTKPAIILSGRSK